MSSFSLYYNQNKKEISNIFLIAFPTIIDLFVQTLLGFFDLIMVGRLGPDAISSVGIGTAPILTIIPLFFSISVGTTALVSRAFGAKNYAETKVGLSQSLIIGIPIAFLVTASFLLFGENILSLISKNQPIEDALKYFNIVSLGLPFLCFNIIFAYGFRAIGRAQIPMYNNIISIFSNIILNYIFIFVLDWGIYGAGLATTISRCLATLTFSFLIFIRKNFCISLSLKDFIFRKDICSRLFKVGFPAAIEQLLFRIGMLIFESMVINLGALQYAAHKIALTAESFSYNLGIGFAVAATSLVGQYLGAKELDKSKQAGYLNAFLAVCVMTIFGFSFMLFPKFIILMFTQDTNIIPVASSALRIISIAQPVLAMSMVFSGALRGAGDTRSILFISTLGMYGIRIPLSYLALYKFGFGLSGAWTVMIIDLTVRGVSCFYRFKEGKWQNITV